MIITKLQRAKDYRIFRDFIWPASVPDFARFNVIYGWNGSGKTSFSNLLRQMQRKQSVSDGTIEIFVDQTRVSGTAFETAPLPEIRVFNRDTVDRSIFELGGKQFPPVFFLGEDSVEKQRQIETLKKQLDESSAAATNIARKKSDADAALDALCAEEARGIKNLLTVAGGGPYNNFNAGNFRTTVQQLAALKELPAPLQERERQRHMDVKDGKSMEKVGLPKASFPDIVALATRTQEMLSRSVVSSVIDKLAENPQLATWVATGLNLHTGHNTSNTCHFCEQQIPNERVSQLQAHFNDEYKRFLNDLDSLTSELERAKHFPDTLELPAKEVLYKNLRDDYEKYASTLRSQSVAASTALDILKRSLSAKRDEPFRSLELLTFITNLSVPDEPSGKWEVFFQAVFGGLAAISAIAGHNAFKAACGIIEAHNKRTDQFDGALREARLALAQDEVLKAVPKWGEALKAVDGLRSKLTTCTDASAALKNQISDLERQIRQHQRPAEELNNEIAAYLGRDELKFTTEQAGYRVTRGDQAALHLSEGERTAIAFLYFLKSLEGTDFNMKTGIVVIDDPVSSLDANSLFSAFGFMKHRTAEAAQLFILTHNFAFFRQVRNWFQHLPKEKRPARFYMLNTEVTDGVRNASIESLDPFLYQYESEYHYLFKRVFLEAERLSKGDLESHYSIPNIARRLLESFLAFRIPDKSGELFKKLEFVEYDAAAKTRILRFLHTYSHFDQVAEPDHDVSVLSETREVLREMLGLMKYTDPGHYGAMVALVAPPAAEA